MLYGCFPALKKVFSSAGKNYSAFIATVHVSIAILALVLVYVSVILTIYSGIIYLKNAKDILLESV